MLLDHISSLLVAFLGSIVAVSWSVSSNATVFLPVIIISVTFTFSAALDVTVTLQLASLPPSAFTVMVASPGATAVTFPLLSTVATLSLLLDQDKLLFVAVEGSIVAVRVSV